ncbi:MAG: DUF695 domain-containing protein [Polyangiales bacterium]
MTATELWEFYEGTVEGQRAFVSIDVSLLPHVPEGARPLTVRVRVPLRHPRPDGLATTIELADLLELEETVLPLVEERLDGRFVAVSTAGGFRDFHFYAAHREGLGEIGRAIRLAFPLYRVEVAVADDPAWNVYRETLYPDELGWRFIRDQRLLAMMSAHGDDVRSPRLLVHQVRFPSEGTRRRFVEALPDGRFEVEACLLRDPSGLFPFGLELTHREPIAPLHVSAESGYLHRLAAASGGSYDGWQAPVVDEVA